jgi:hypothetical protein
MYFGGRCLLKFKGHAHGGYQKIKIGDGQRDHFCEKIRLSIDYHPH